MRNTARPDAGWTARSEAMEDTSKGALAALGGTPKLPLLPHPWLNTPLHCAHADTENKQKTALSRSRFICGFVELA